MIDEALINLPLHGFVNTHPSLLPHNRGKHSNFWALVEQAPFGVSLHFVDAGIDSGPIIAQQAISYSWEDTGETLYFKAQEAMIGLFAKVYPELRQLRINARAQDLSLGSFHWGADMDQKCEIALDSTYTARELLNLLRGPTAGARPR